MNKDNYLLVTGTGGFIGFHLAKRLLDEGYKVIGVDSMNDYYDVNLKWARTEILKSQGHFEFYQMNLVNGDQVNDLFEKYQFEYVVNLAAQAGVRYSLTNPMAYIESNITGFVNILEACKRWKIKHLVYASSSSVYGANTQMPFSEHQSLNHPISLYAATKKSNELLAHAYAVNFGLPSTGLRFFSVYGPWGRPDMALFIFTKSMVEDVPFDVFNNGKMTRNFTYIDDVVEGVYRLIPQIAKPNPSWDSSQPDPATSFAPFRVYNIGNNAPVDLMGFIHLIEKELGRTAKMNYLPMQMGDIPATFADISELYEAVGYKASTSIEDGIHQFVSWFKEYYYK